jgi:hypothetical protein
MGIGGMIRRIAGGAKGRHQRRNRHAIHGRFTGQRRRVDLHFKGRTVQEGRAFCRDHPQLALHLGQRPFDQKHRSNLGAVGKQPRGLVIAEKAGI